MAAQYETKLYSAKVQQPARMPVDVGVRVGTLACGDRCGWTCCLLMACKRPGVRVPDGKRIRRKVSGRTKQEVKDKLAALHGNLDAGIRRPDARYTVTQAVADWLAEGLDGRSEKTVALNRHVLQPVVDIIGKVALRDLTTRDARRVLAEIAATHSSRTVVVTHNAPDGRSGTPRPTTTCAATWRRWSGHPQDSRGGPPSRSRPARPPRC